MCKTRRAAVLRALEEEWISNGRIASTPPRHTMQSIWVACGHPVQNLTVGENSGGMGAGQHAQWSVVGFRRI